MAYSGAKIKGLQNAFHWILFAGQRRTFMKTRFGLSGFESVLPRASASPGAGMASILVFDACHVGVVLRTVLAVLALVGVGAMFVTHSVQAWLALLALVTGAALPAALLWLVAACALKRPLQQLSLLGQGLCAMGLGVLAGLYGCAMLVWIGFVSDAPWAASGVSGALIASGLFAALVWRAQRRQPASDAARLLELQARIRPHFLFNTLNSAIALVRYEPARAETLLEDLSELFRYAVVDQGDAALLGQEIELAQRYLAIEQVRFGQRLRVQWAIDSRCLSAKLPPLILQPLVENAVKHGVEPSATGADLKISADLRGRVVVIKITNTAPGGQGVAGHGVALHNVQERLRLMHDVQMRFRCTWVDGIYQVRMEIPA
jgi:two-component system, LytTR family, sensor histidine kinase AlgZ